MKYIHWIGDIVKIVVIVKNELGINKIIAPDGLEISSETSNKTEIRIDYGVKLGENYIFKVQNVGTTQQKEYPIKIELDTLYEDLKITEGLIAYWPLKHDIWPIKKSKELGDFVSSKNTVRPEFNEKAYRMNENNYLINTVFDVISSPKTMAAQFKLDKRTNDYIIFGSQDRYSTSCYGIYNNRTYNGRYGFGDAINYDEDKYIGQWINAVFTQDEQGNSTLYFNGEIVSQGIDGEDNKIQLRLGSGADGLLKNFVIYNRVLSQEEATNIFK